MKTLLVPLDFSPASSRVVDVACNLATLMKARIEFLNVYQPSPALSGEYMMYAPEAHVAAEQYARKFADKELKQMVRRAEARGLAARGFFRLGFPVDEILAQAKKAAFIVIGSHGHTALYDMVVGGTTHRVLRGAQCPVVVVPITPGKKGRKARQGRATVRG